jgi:AcrR family transcriptional regulator
MSRSVETETLSLRERKKLSTRDALRRAAVELTAERGIAAVTVDDIAATVGVSTRTFFNYFPSKEDAVVGWDPDRLAALIGYFNDAAEQDTTFAALGRAVAQMIGSADPDHADWLRRMQVISSDPGLVAHHAGRWADLERELVAAVAARRGRSPEDDDYSALVVATVLASCRVAVMAWCRDGAREQITDYLFRNLRLLQAGLQDVHTAEEQAE